MAGDYTREVLFVIKAKHETVNPKWPILYWKQHKMQYKLEEKLRFMGGNITLIESNNTPDNKSLIDQSSTNKRITWKFGYFFSYNCLSNFIVLQC